MLDLAIVILNYNTKDLVLKCLESIFKRKWSITFEVWVVDNASKDTSVKEIRENFPKVKLIINNKNLGFSKGNNLALKKIGKKARYSLLLNSDTEVLPKSLDNLVKFADRSDADIVSCELLNPNGSFQPNGGELPSFLPMFFWLSGIDDVFRKIFPLPSFHQEDKKYYQDGKEVGWVSGSVMLIKNAVFEKIGFLDSKIFMYGEDVDFCWRAKKAGFKNLWTDRAQIVHIGGASFEKAKLNQWGGELKGLFYLYNKYYGFLAVVGLRILAYFFTVLRIIAFFLLGKRDYAKTYAKIITKI